MNEVNLTTANFLTGARGIQVQAKDAINSAVRDINQDEFQWPFNHSTNTQVLSPGKVRYASPSSFKYVDYETFRILNAGDGNTTQALIVLDYREYIDKLVYQEDNQVDTLLDGSLTDSATTVTVDSTTGFTTTGDVQIEDEVITYTGVTSTTFTGCTRGASSTTAVTHADNAVITQFSGGGVPSHIVRTPDNNFLLFPFPNKTCTLEFDYYTSPTELSADTDVPTIPSAYRSVLVDGSMYYLYQYRKDNTTASLSQERFKSGIKRMRTLLINAYPYLRSSYRPNSTGRNSISMGSRYHF